MKKSSSHSLSLSISNTLCRYIKIHFCSYFLTNVSPNAGLCDTAITACIINKQKYAIQQNTLGSITQIYMFQFARKVIRHVYLQSEKENKFEQAIIL